MAGNRDLGVDNVADQVGALLAAFNLDDLGAAFFDEASGVEQRIFWIHLIRTVGHVGDEKSVLHAAADGFHMVQHLVHGDGERVFVSKHGLGQRIADQDHLDASFIDQARRRVVVGCQAGNGLVLKLQVPQGCGSNLPARLADRGQTHGVLQCPSASGG